MINAVKRWHNDKWGETPAPAEPPAEVLAEVFTEASAEVVTEAPAEASTISSHDGAELGKYRVI